MSGRLRQEDGWALVTALVLMTIMAGFGASLLAFADNEERQSAVGRQRETAFNVAEAALNAQIHALARPGQWPGAGGATNTQVAYPPSCDQSAPSGARACPDAATITSLFSSPDTGTPTTWSTIVRDNSGVAGAETFWQESLTASTLTYDANDDGTVWVRAQASARNRVRTLVALVRSEQRVEDLPHVTLLAGRLDISNNGNKVIIDSKGTSATTGPVSVRCTPVMNEATPCLGHELGSGSIKSLGDLTRLLDKQIAPNVSTSAYAGASTALSADALVRLQETAIANGTYHTSCPSSLAGAVVYIETTSACSYSSSGTVNSASAPGLVIMTGGKLTVAGGLVYHGLLYHANLANSSGPLLELGGTAEVHGGAIVDGAGTFVAGSSKFNLVFDDRAFTNVRSFGNVGLIQNTWREIS